MAKTIAIVGAGVGGLATAARLGRRGYDVDVYEKLPRAGGRNHLLADEGYRFDMGPSFVLMPDFYEEVFASCGCEIRDFLRLAPVDPAYVIFFPDGRSLKVHHETLKTKQELEKFEAGSALAFDRLMAETARIYRATRPMLFNCFTPRDLMRPRIWPLAFRLRVFESYWGLVCKYFRTEELRYAFTFEAMFMGVSPFAAPAFYSIISYADHVQKIFHPIGGMYEIPLALEKMARSFGARFHYGVPIESIEKNNGTFTLRSAAGELAADRVVVNADYSYAQEKLLGRSLPSYRYSCSVYLLYLGIKKKMGKLAHHNLFFARDLRRNLRQIFQTHEVPQDPSFYVHVPTVTDASLAPTGKDIYYVLVPVPNMEKAPDDGRARWEKQLRAYVLNKIGEVVGVNLEDLIEVEHRFYPKDFDDRYNIKYGATFGLAHTLSQSAFLRPPNADRRLKGLYYVGASTQPGGGLPPVLAGSRIVADLIDRDFVREG